MTTLSEIEAAAEALPLADREYLLAWLSWRLRPHAIINLPTSARYVLMAG
jgi:hypothetical protein